MSRFTTGFMAGSLLGAIGIGVAMNDKMTRKKMIKSGKRMMNKAEYAWDNLADTVEDTIDSML